MISQLYVLSPRGDTIINRDFRGDIVKGTAEIFFRKVKFWTGDAPPIFNIDGINYIYIKRNGLYFVCTTNYNLSPSFLVDFLQRITKVLKDFCGVLNEEAIRKNFVLVYELLDEMLDFGYPQMTTTESLRQCIHNDAIVVADGSSASTGPGGKLATSVAAGAVVGFTSAVTPKTIPSNASQRPIGTSTGGGGRKNEVFVDILERLTVVLNSSGYVVNSAIDGSIQLKSYLSGSPELRLALNEDIQIGNTRGGSSSGLVVLDDCNFHECVDLTDFAAHRILAFNAPDGEFTVMNYRLRSAEFRVPFRLYPILDVTSPTKLSLVIKIRAEIPEQNYGGNVVASCPMPKHTTAVATETFPLNSLQTAEFLQTEGRTVWTIKKLQGGSEHTLRCRITLSQPAPPSIRKEVGPISLQFEIPMYTMSNLQVRYLRIWEQQRTYNPHRWVRYVTQSSSYICRL
eukprot:GHVS01008501.1.p1 GENE.GHVS01008501.1~~GHVS01008501.1.p1  ORF type:complete len:506 (+),score=55.34 GHVS01008501.1:152-1519(+)